MGALHEGHLALIRRSAAENERTVVSVFVNAPQFNDPADLQGYPRSLEGDVRMAADAGADVSTRRMVWETVASTALCSAASSAP